LQLASCVAAFFCYNNSPPDAQQFESEPQRASAQPQTAKAHESAFQIIDPGTSAEVNLEDLAKTSSSVNSQSASSGDATPVSNIKSTKTRLLI